MQLPGPSPPPDCVLPRASAALTLSEMSTLPMLLERKIVFITGSASGIGRDCALACAREGASVVVADIDGEAARRTADELGSGSMALECDVTHRDSVDRAVGAVGPFGTRAAPLAGLAHYILERKH